LRLILLKNHLEYKFLNFDRYDLFQSFCFWCILFWTCNAYTVI
jgi:hypothetical protein